MRIPYQVVSTATGVLETRPCCDVLFLGDPDAVPRQALVDSGSLHTVVSASALEGIELGEPVRLINLSVCRWELKDAPIHRLDMRIVAPSAWDNIELPDVPVVVANEPIPFVLLGSSALTHLVVLIRDADQCVHLKTHEAFEQTRHRRDKSF